MLKRLFDFLFKDLSIFSCAYSNNIFPSPLSKEEENELITNLINGDKESRNKLIEHNLRLVAHIVKKYDNNSYLNTMKWSNKENYDGGQNYGKC